MSLYLKPGDTVECEIERIGVLRNQVVSADVPAAV
jgi:2-keto-4-pentenoate hydratase/2-oxohepta-3-ene-1,7-dioic acid hydratase in catechol pathway